MCDYLQTVLSPLASSGKLDLSTSGPSTTGKSLLNADQDFWGTASAQRAAGELHNYKVISYHAQSTIVQSILTLGCGCQLLHFPAFCVMALSSSYRSDTSNFDSPFIEYLANEAEGM